MRPVAQALDYVLAIRLDFMVQIIRLDFMVQKLCNTSFQPHWDVRS